MNIKQFINEINPELMEDEKTSYAGVSLCTAKAGGDIYADFYKMLLGCFS